jgi:hypothetical protein
MPCMNPKEPKIVPSRSQSSRETFRTTKAFGISRKYLLGSDEKSGPNVAHRLGLSIMSGRYDVRVHGAKDESGCKSALSLRSKSNFLFAKRVGSLFELLHSGISRKHE